MMMMTVNTTSAITATPPTIPPTIAKTLSYRYDGTGRMNPFLFPAEGGNVCFGCRQIYLYVSIAAPLSVNTQLRAQYMI